MTTDTSEKGLETLIMRHMTGVDGLAVTPGVIAEPPAAGGTGYFAASAKDYDRAHVLDVPRLFAFLRATQPEAFTKLGIASSGDPKDINSLPRREQEEIVAFILAETSSLTTAISRLSREIDLLREYRTRLVADVVTGKLDVREAAARLPDEAAADISEDNTELSDDDAQLVEAED